MDCQLLAFDGQLCSLDWFQPFDHLLTVGSASAVECIRVPPEPSLDSSHHKHGPLYIVAVICYLPTKLDVDYR